MHRIVIDTNVLVASAYNRRSASRRIVDAVAEGKLELILSPGIQREYNRILPRAVCFPAELERLRAIIAAGQQVHPKSNPPVTEDREDDKFLAAASAGAAEAVITNDPHLLSVDCYEGIRVVRPSSFERLSSDNEDKSPPALY